MRGKKISTIVIVLAVIMTSILSALGLISMLENPKPTEQKSSSTQPATVEFYLENPHETNQDIESDAS